MRYPALKYFLVQLILLLVLQLPVFVFAQQISWLQTGHSVQDNSGNSDVWLWDMKADSRGNLILAGSYGHTYSKTWQNDYSIFAGTILKSQKLNKGEGFSSGFISKMDPAGRLIWIKQIEGQAYPDGFLSEIFHLELDENDNIYFSGTANADLNLTFGGVAFPKYAKSKTPDFIGKADSAGNIISLTRFWDGSPAGNNNIYNIYNFRVDKAGNYFIRGHLNRYESISSGNFSQPANPNLEFDYIAKFTSDGDLLGINLIDSSIGLPPGGPFFTLDENGNIYTRHIEGNNQYLAQYSSTDLSLKKQIRIGRAWPPVNIYPVDVVTDEQDNLYISGYFTDTLRIGLSAAIVKPGNNGFIAKLNQDLQVLWIKLSTLNSGGGLLSIGPKNKIYALGMFNGSSIGFGNRSLTFPDSANRYFIAGFDTSGNCLNLIGLNGFNDAKHSGLTNFAPFFHVDQCDNLYLAGYVQKEFQFNTLHLDFTDYLYQRGCFVTKFTWDSIHYIPLSTCGKIRLQNQSAIPGAKYYWMYGNTVLDTTYHLEYVFPKSGRYPITLVSDKVDGCHSVYTDTVNFTRMLTAFSTQQEQGCQWVGYKFRNTSLKDSGYTYAWYWDFGDGTSDTAQNPMHVYTKSGNYTVTLVSNNGSCTDTFAQVQAVNILPAPKPGFRVSDSVGCAPLTVVVTPVTRDNNQKYKYAFGDGHIDSAITPTYTYTAPGYYWLKQEITSNTGCVTKDSIPIQLKEGLSPTDTPQIEEIGYLDWSRVEMELNLQSLANFRYEIYKHTPGKKPELVIRTPFRKTSLHDILIDSTDNDSPKEPFWYTVVAIDECGRRSAESKPGAPPILFGENIDNRAFFLHWIPQEKYSPEPDRNQLFVNDNKAVVNDFDKMVSDRLSDAFKDTFRSYGTEQQCYMLQAHSQTFVLGYSNTICIPYLPTVFIPDAFTPNKDGINDTFRVVSLGMQELSLSIYDRWGQRIFSSTNSTAEWDGTKDGLTLPSGVYLFTLSCRTNKGERIYKTGNITLMK
jgi:gliding motility-associated-like protein